MLFRTGDLDEVERRNERRDAAEHPRGDGDSPALPLMLEPGRTWRGDDVARPGRSRPGGWVRVVFGALIPVRRPAGRAPTTKLVWITDNAYQLLATESSSSRQPSARANRARRAGRANAGS